MGIILLNHFHDSYKGEVHKIISKEWHSPISGINGRIGLLIWNMPANSKRELEHVTILHEVSVSVAHWWAEPAQFLVTKNMVVDLHAPYLPCDYSHFHEWNQIYKVTDSSCPRNYWCLICDNKMSVPAMLLTVAETPDTLHKLEQKWEIKR